MKTELYINGTRVNLSQEVNASLNYAIADIREPEKRNGAFSRSVKLYCDSVLSQVLDAIFEIGYNTQTSGIVNFMPDFNPNLKAPFVLYADGMEQLRGYMRLRSIDRDEQGLQRMYYNVELYGMLANIFTDLGDKKMGELDYSSDNHIYNRTNQQATWTNVDADDGNYVYPMINYGTVPSENTWKVTDFFPSISLKSLVDKIVTGVGYQYDSTFFDSSYFKKQYITFTGDKLTLSASGGANSLFSPVLVMHVRWDKLEFCIPLEGDCFLVFHAGLVVENLEVHQETPCCQACHNGIVGCNLMAVTFGLVGG
jgi:hypothetical protein